jgi:dolichol-phosphate mannosyltransferase
VSAPTELSIVIPFFNEEENVRPLLEELLTTIAALGISAELVLIDDGSTDRTGAVLEQCAREYTSAVVHRFTRNLGQAAALWFGIKAAKGRWIATFDGDGQNPPGELPKLWARRHEADLIAGRRANRQDSPLRRTMSRVANAVRRRLLDDGVDDTGCALKVFRREVRESFLPLKTLYSFMPACAKAGGWTVLQVPIEHRPRLRGESKYGLGVMAWKPLVDLLALCVILRRLVPTAHLGQCTSRPKHQTLL